MSSLGVAERVIPGFCRQALEAASTGAVRRRRIGRGERYVEVEAELAKATTLYMRLSLALFDEPDRGSDVLKTVANRFGAPAANAVRLVNKGVHEELGADLGELVRDTAVLARKLAE